MYMYIIKLVGIIVPANEYVRNTFKSIILYYTLSNTLLRKFKIICSFLGSEIYFTRKVFLYNYYIRHSVYFLRYL